MDLWPGCQVGAPLIPMGDPGAAQTEQGRDQTASAVWTKGSSSWEASACSPCLPLASRLGLPLHTPRSEQLPEGMSWVSPSPLRSTHRAARQLLPPSPCTRAFLSPCFSPALPHLFIPFGGLATDPLPALYTGGQWRQLLAHVLSRWVT